MLPSVPERKDVSGGRGGLIPSGRHGRTRAGWLVARDTAGASAGSAVVGLIASLGTHSSLVGVITGGAVWLVSCAGVALGAWLRAFRKEASDPIDPWALPEPWRGLVRDAVNAGRRFEVTAASLPAGPLRDHVTALEPALGRQVRSVWETAQRGAALTGGFPPGSRPETVASLSEQLRSVQAERSLPENGADDRLAELDRTEEIVAARLREAKRAESVAAWLRDGLRSAITRLEAAVTSLAELAGQESVTSERGDLPGSLDAVEEQLSALQAGMQEVTGALPPGGPPPNRSKP